MRFPTVDCYFRAHYVQLWMDDPFFAPGDHLWLGGHFAGAGALGRLFGSAVWGVHAFSILSCAAALVGLYYLGRRLVPRSPWPARVALLLGMANPWTLFYLHAGLADLGSVAFNLWGLGFLVSAYERFRAGDRGWLGRLAGAALAFDASASLRYEAWMPAAMLAGALAAFACIALYRRRWKAAGLLALLSLVAVSYPLAWMLSSHLRLGGFWAFIENNELQRFVIIGGTRYETLGAKLTVVPIFLWRLAHANAHGLVLLLGVAAAFRYGSKRLRYYTAFLLIYIAYLSVHAANAGFSANHPERILLIPYFALLPVMSFGLCKLAQFARVVWSRAGRGRPPEALLPRTSFALFAAALAFLVFLPGFQSARELLHGELSPYATSPAAEQAGRLLGRELAEAPEWQSDKVRIALGQWGYARGDHLAILLETPLPLEDVIIEWEEEPGEKILFGGGASWLVARLGDLPVPYYWEPRWQVGDITILRRRPPKAFLILKIG